MLRLIFSLALLTLPLAARPLFSPYLIEARLTRADVPTPVEGDFAFGERVRLDGDWLAVSETRFDKSLGKLLSVHLFHREPGQGVLSSWVWRQSLDLGAFWTGALLPDQVAFDFNEGRLVVPNDFPGGVTFYSLDENGTWSVDETLTEVDGGPVYGSSLMCLRGPRLFVPDTTDGGRVRVLVQDAGTAEWSVEAVVPWPALTNDSWNPPAMATDGSRLILRADRFTLDADDFPRVEIRSLALGWQVEATLQESPRRVKRSYGASRYGESVAIDGDQAYVLSASGVDFIGNPMGPSSTIAYRCLRGQWKEQTHALTPWTANTVVANHDLVGTLGYMTTFMGDYYGGDDRTFIFGSPLRYESPLPDGASSVDFGPQGRMAASTCVFDLFGNVSGQMAVVYRNPMVGGWWK